MDKVPAFSLGGHNLGGVATLADRLRQAGRAHAAQDAPGPRHTLRLPTGAATVAGAGRVLPRALYAASVQGTKGEAEESVAVRSPDEASASPAAPSVEEGVGSGEKPAPHPLPCFTSPSSVAELPPNENLGNSELGSS
jgi:hypothetical protein